MGHLINARGFRVGWTQVWCDQWYSNNLYYAEYLYSCLRIRYFLIYFYFTKAVDKMGVFFSHFEIMKYSKSLFVRLFYYDAIAETEYDDFIIGYLDRFDEQRKSFRRAKRKTKKPAKILVDQSWIALVLFRFFISFSLYTPPFRRPLSLFIKALHLLRFGLIHKLLQRSLKVRHLRGSSARFLFLSLVYIKLMEVYSKVIYKFDFVPRFFFLFYFSVVAKNFNVSMSNFIQFICSALTNFSNISVHFFLVSNDSITAAFLARFIAKKLNQNLSLKEVLNPLKREFYKVWRKSHILATESFKRYNKVLTDFGRRKKFFKQVWRYFLIYFISSYCKYSLRFFQLTQIWLSLDITVTLNWLNTTLLRKNCKQFSRKFFNNRALFVYFFFYNFSSFTRSSNKILFPFTAQVCISPIINFVSFFNPIFFDLFISRFSLFQNLNSIAYSLNTIKLLILI